MSGLEPRVSALTLAIPSAASIPKKHRLPDITINLAVMLRSNNILPSSSPTLFNTTNTPISSSTNSNNNQQLSWEFLRKQARQLENEIEQKLTSYSKIAASVGRTRNRELGSGNASLAGRGGNNVGNSNEAMELELDELVKKLSMVVSSMAEVVDRPSSTTTNPSMMHMLQRHRDILYDYTKEFKKTKANIQAARNHADLLSSVREDISSFKSGATSETDYFLSERSRIESSHRMTDIIIEQAYETREEFGRQRATLLNINSRMGGIKGLFPSLNSLIGRINTRKKRDTLILAVVVSTCIILLFLYMKNI